MDYYNKNLSLLASTQPDLADQIAAYTPPVSTVEVIASKKGPFTFKKNVSAPASNTSGSSNVHSSSNANGSSNVHSSSNANGLGSAKASGITTYTVHSAYDPEKEAVRMVDGYMQELIEFSNIVVFGGGFYYHIKELLKRIDTKFDFILVVEHDAEIFKNALRCCDLSSVLGRPEIFFAISESPIGIFRFLQGKGISLVANELTILKHTTLCKTTDYYSSVEKQIKDVCIWARVNVSAQVKTTDTYCRNIFKNMPMMLKNPGVKNLFSIFESVPAVLVAAGPSLSKNIDFLHEVKNNFLIVAVDTALKVLLRHGIQPHIVASIDYTPDNMRYFEGVGEIDSFLVADPEVYPDIFTKYQGQKMVADLANKSLCLWLQKQGVDKGVLSKGLSVAHTCFEIAKDAGCDPIVFVGQDLAYSGGLSHAKGAVMATAVNDENVDGGVIKVRDVFGGEVSTSTALSVFINHFVEKVYSSGVKCIDATEGGAFIEGTEVMSLRHVIHHYSEKGLDDVWQTLKECSFENEKIDLNKIKSKAKSTAKEFEKFASFAKEAKKLMKKLLESLRAENKDNSAIAKNLVAWKEVSVKMHNFDSLIAVLRDNITDALVVHAKKSLAIRSLGDLSQEDERKKVRAAADRDRFFYGKIEESAMFMADQFKKLYGEL